MLITMLCFSRYRIAAKYSNKRVFQHWCKEGCRTTSWKDLMPQRAHDEGASNATFRWRVWCHLAKLHVCEVCKAFEYLEVIRYIGLLYKIYLISLPAYDHCIPTRLHSLVWKAITCRCLRVLLLQGFYRCMVTSPQKQLIWSLQKTMYLEDQVSQHDCVYIYTSIIRIAVSRITDKSAFFWGTGIFLEVLYTSTPIRLSISRNFS